MKFLIYLKGHPWLLSLILIVVIAGPGFVRIEQISNKTNRAVAKSDNIITCVTNWADAFVNRADTLSIANNKRLDAQDYLLRAASRGDREDLIKGLNDYVIASDEYKNLLKINPIPQSPKLVCF